MNINELIQKGKNALKQANIEDANIQAKTLLCSILEKNMTYLITNSNDDVSNELEEKYLYNINKLLSGIPIQYITHLQKFMGLNFYVDENVLIPQPDTETLVEEVLRNYKTTKNLKVLDLCTGSGAIAISLAKYMDNSTKITAVDISEDALKVAKKNANINSVSNIIFIKSNMFQNIDEKYDIIVSNPPYIETEIIKTLSKQVQNEPHLALDGGKDGLDFYRILIEKSPNFLNDNGSLFLEIGYNQKDLIYNLVIQSNKYNQVECKKDLAGNDRVVIAKF